MNWQTVKLGDVAKFIRGITFKPTDVTQLGNDGIVGVMRTKNVQAQIDLSDVWGLPAKFIKRDEQILREGDLLVSTANSWNLVGKCCWVPRLDYAATFGGFISVLRAGETLDQQYLYHWFSSPNTQEDLRSCGRQTTNISNMDLKRAADLEIPLPPLSEQKRLAAILDRADTTRRLRRESLARLDELAQSLFLELFGDPVRNEKGWPCRGLAEVAMFENGDRSANYPSGDDIKSDGVLFLSTKNIVKNRIDLSNSAFITQEKFRSLSRGKAQRMDLIITLRGTLGSCCIFNCAYDTAFINAQMMILRPREGMTSGFLHALLTSKPAQERFARIGHGAAVPQLTAAQLSKLPIPLPLLPLQQKFAEQIAELEAIKVRARASLLELDALFASLQARAFAGELSGAA